jgi:hypothetical protein
MESELSGSLDGKSKSIESFKGGTVDVWALGRLTSRCGAVNRSGAVITL